MESCKRARKANFSSAECSLILQLAEENLEVIREKFSSTLTNKKKQAVWQSISDRVNALGMAKRSTTDVKDKWRAMCGAARKEMSRERSSIGKTGGGKSLPPLKATSQRIIELFGDEPGFSGIQGGIESGECQFAHAQQKLLFKMAKFYSILSVNIALFLFAFGAHFTQELIV